VLGASSGLYGALTDKMAQAEHGLKPNVNVWSTPAATGGGAEGGTDDRFGFREPHALHTIDAQQAAEADRRRSTASGEIPTN